MFDYLFVACDLKVKLANCFYFSATGVFFSDGEHWQESRRFVVKHLRAFGKVETENLMKEEIDILASSIKDGCVIQVIRIYLARARVRACVWACVNVSHDILFVDVLEDRIRGCRLNTNTADTLIRAHI